MTQTSRDRDGDELAKLRAEREAKAKAEREELVRLREEKFVRDNHERVGLVAQLVVLGRETPATAWVNSDGKTPRGSLATMPLEELRERVNAFGGAPRVGSAPQPPSSGGVITASSDPIEISEYEAKRVTLLAQENKVDPTRALERYREVRLQQFNGAKLAGHDVRKFGRRIEEAHVLASVTGKITPASVHTLTNPVTPIETFSPASQRAMEEWRLEYMVQLAAMPPDWTQMIGGLLPSGALLETYPLDFSAVQYQERKAQGAPAETPQSVDIQVAKREFRAAKMGDLRRINAGDFSYIQSWQAGAAQFARARVRLRASLVVALLEAGTSGYWGSSATRTTGIDGQAFFSAAHKVHPFNSKIKFHGSATWSNYTAAATPFGAANLTASKAAMLLVPHFDGLELQTRATDVLVPTILDEPARLLLTVQDVILAAASSLDGVSNVMGSVRNEHYNSGFGRIWAPQLTGSDSTADYYLISRETIAMGFMPWVIAEDAAEELLTWDENSEFYKSTNHIKIESKLYANAALLWPHGIRLVKGA